MRLIGKLENEKQAFVFYSYLLSEGIHSTYETAYDPEEKKHVVSIWIYEEDEVEKAQQYLKEFKQNPSDPRFVKVEFPQAPPQPPDTIAEAKSSEEKKKAGFKLQIPSKPRKRKVYPFTYFVIFVCVLLYFWNTAEQVTMIREDGREGAQIGFTPLQRILMFDYPQSNQEVDKLLQKYSLKNYKDLKNLPSDELTALTKAQQIPTWKGILPIIMKKFKKVPSDEPVRGPMFEQIRKGEVWRLFTPCLLHGSLLHILFNMAWVFILMRQVEERLSLWKLLILIVIIGVTSNVAQYFVSGPYFLGFSGIVVGLVGFIWVRQKVAPWEGYPLNKTTFIFILIFILAMFVLEIVSLLTAIIAAKEISANIANTAHIVGGVCGILLGKISFFGRGFK